MRKASALVLRSIAMVAGIVVALAAERASAQRPDPTPRQGTKYKPTPLNLQREQLGSAGLPEAARSRMRSGDCAGALDVFDAALNTYSDPTLHRDRGLCHEKLGHVYPAIDDYRAYLTESPDATDAAGIAQRLRHLEDQTSGRQSSAVADDDDTPPGLRIGAAEEAAAAAKASKKGSSTDAAAMPGNGTTRSDKLDYVSPEEDVLHTPLRAGSGVSLAPLFALHKWLFRGDSFGDSQTWSETFGIQVRYAFGSSGALVMEVGYERFNSTSVDPSTSSGLSTQVGYELRFPLDPEYDNQLLLVPGVGYEHLAVTFTDGSTPALAEGAFVPRIRLGWRHMIQPATAFDVSVDFGVGDFFRYSHFPFDSNSPATGLLALQASVAWGL